MMSALSATDAVLGIGLALSVILPLAVIAVAVRGYRRTGGDRTALRLAVGVLFVTAVPTLLRLGFGAVAPGGEWTPLLIRLVELAGLLIIVGVMHDV
jgi:hypothetical protein